MRAKGGFGSVYPKSPGRAVARQGLPLESRDLGIAHALEEVITLVELANMSFAEPAILLAYRRIEGAGALFRPFDGRRSEEAVLAAARPFTRLWRLLAHHAADMRGLFHATPLARGDPDRIEVF